MTPLPPVTHSKARFHEPLCSSSAISQSQKEEGGERSACTFPNQVSHESSTTPRWKTEERDMNCWARGSRSRTELQGNWLLWGQGSPPTAAIRKELLAARKCFSTEAWEKKVFFVIGKLIFKTRGSLRLLTAAVGTLTRKDPAFSTILLLLACVKKRFCANCW